MKSWVLLYQDSTDCVQIAKGDVTLVNLQCQPVTLIFRNACFLHEFADVTLLNRFQKLPTRCSTGNIAKNRSQRYTRMIFCATSYHCKLVLQVDQCNITLRPMDFHIWQAHFCQCHLVTWTSVWLFHSAFDELWDSFRMYCKFKSNGTGYPSGRWSVWFFYLLFASSFWVNCHDVLTIEMHIIIHYFGHL